MELSDELKNIKGENGNNLYEHLLNILGKILIENPENPYELFEEYSQEIKQNGFNLTNINTYLKSNRILENKETLKEFIEKSSKFYGLVKEEVNEDDAPVEQGPIGYIPNLLDEESIMRNCGISLGENITYQIYISLKKLCQEKSAQSIKFWGKINAIKNDYYIAEALIEGIESEEIAEPHEPKGTGINKKIYFVCTDLFSNEWIELPMLLPKHIIQSRRLKYILKGNLESNIISSPVFEGKEKHFLKAQILRISHNCEIVSKFIYKVKSEDDGGDPNLQEIEKEDEENLKIPTLNDYKNIDHWVHLNQTILKEGRIMHLEIEPEDPEVDKEELMKKIVLEDQFEERLKPISEDRYKDLTKTWNLRTFGNLNEYRNLYTNKISFDTIIVIKSLIWPGYYNFITETKQFSIYLGNGLKYDIENYYPKFPYIIQSENKENDLVKDPVEEVIVVDENK